MGRGGNDYDVAIIGGGLVGASLAVALAPLGKRIVLIEASPFPAAAQPGWDERCIALNDATRRIFESLGVWDSIRPEAEPILATHISERGRFGIARFSAQEAGIEALGYNTPMRTIGAALLTRLKSAENVRLLTPAKLAALQSSDEGIELDVGESLPRLMAKLVVAADGAQSPVRTMLGIGAEEKSYRQIAIVGAVRPERPHQGVAYERFTPEGPLALLPRPEGRCTLVWTVPTEKADEILGWTDDEFLRQFHAAFGNRLGRFLETGRRQGYPLARVMSDRLTAPRVIFAGNAAQTLHPVAAQGFNLGLRDVAAVAEVVAGAADPGAPEVLREYESRRTDDRSRIAGFTDRLVLTFSNRLPGLHRLRHLGLLALDLIPPVKQAVMRQNLGYSGTTPALARGVPLKHQ